MFMSRLTSGILAAGTGLAILGSAALLQVPGKTELQSVIVQGSDIASVKAAVLSVGGEITHELGIIDAVSVKLSDAKLDTLRERKELEGMENR